jgi:uncharacterized protein YkwD
MKHLIVLAAVFCTAFAAPVASAQPTPAESQLVRAINRARSQHGLAPLRVDPSLERAARAHSRTLLRTGTFGHTDFGVRLMRFGPAIGENLAWGVGTQAAAPVIVQAWLASPPHRNNMLRPGFRRLGIGRAVGTFRGYPNAAVITADFAGR